MGRPRRPVPVTRRVALPPSRLTIQISPPYENAIWLALMVGRCSSNGSKDLGAAETAALAMQRSKSIQRRDMILILDCPQILRFSRKKKIQGFRAQVQGNSENCGMARAPVLRGWLPSRFLARQFPLHQIFFDTVFVTVLFSRRGK